jgi:hypothetical protein
MLALVTRIPIRGKICTCVSLYVCEREWVCKCGCVDVWVSFRLHTCVRVNVWMCVSDLHVCACVCLCLRVCMHVHVRILHSRQYTVIHNRRQEHASAGLSLQHSFEQARTPEMIQARWKQQQQQRN